MKSNYRKIYKEALIKHFNDNNICCSEQEIKSIMNKVAINSRNKYGRVSFEDELNESYIDAGLYFYKEGFKSSNTYNNRNK